MTIATTIRVAALADADAIGPEDDTAARKLYESLGFSNREPSGALNLFYEREL